MDRVIRKFNSFAEAEAAEIEDSLKLTPEERIELVLQLQEQWFTDAPSQGFARVYRITQLEQS